MQIQILTYPTASEYDDMRHNEILPEYATPETLCEMYKVDNVCTEQRPITSTPMTPRPSLQQVEMLLSQIENADSQPSSGVYNIMPNDSLFETTGYSSDQRERITDSNGHSIGPLYSDDTTEPTEAEVEQSEDKEQYVQDVFSVVVVRRGPTVCLENTNYVEPGSVYYKNMLFGGLKNTMELIRNHPESGQIRHPREPDESVTTGKPIVLDIPPPSDGLTLKSTLVISSTVPEGDSDDGEPIDYATMTRKQARRLARKPIRLNLPAEDGRDSILVISTTVPEGDSDDEYVEGEPIDFATMTRKQARRFKDEWGVMEEDEEKAPENYPLGGEDNPLVDGWFEIPPDGPSDEEYWQEVLAEYFCEPEINLDQLLLGVDDESDSGYEDNDLEVMDSDDEENPGYEDEDEDQPSMSMPAQNYLDQEESPQIPMGADNQPQEDNKKQVTYARIYYVGEIQNTPPTQLTADDQPLIGEEDEPREGAMISDELLTYYYETEAHEIETREQNHQFLADLIPNPENENPNAEHYKVNFEKEKGTLARKLYNIFNKICFNGRLPNDTEILWNDDLPKIAGFCLPGITDTNQRSFSIHLSEILVNTPERTRDVLIHEMCHGAVWWKYGEVNPPHGDRWRRCVKRVERCLKNILEIKVTHSYLRE